MANDKIDIRRNKEGSLHQKVANDLTIRRQPLKKQVAYRKKVKSSKAEYTFLQFHHIIWMWALANHNISSRDLNVLLYMYPLISFTSKEFTQALNEMESRDLSTVSRMKEGGWLNIWSKQGKTIHYVLSNKANTLVSRLHRMFMGEEEIPMSPRRNKLIEENKENQELLKLFKKFNQKVKENDEKRN